MAKKHRANESAWKGLVAGVAGGLAGSLVMGLLESMHSEEEGRLWTRMSGRDRTDLTHLGQAPGRRHIQMASHPAVQEVLAEKTHEPGPTFLFEEPASVAVASVISKKVFKHPLTEREKNIAAPAVQFSVGALIGGLYGLAAEMAPAVTIGNGAAMGAGVMVATEELGKPALGISPLPLKKPISRHSWELWTHLAFGVTCETARRMVRRLI
jgi:hypothetical protein